jgi:TolB-like protein
MLLESSTERGFTGTDQAAVLTELERVLASPLFGSSRRQARLLRFLVGEVLAGRGHALRAPQIAEQVFDRPKGFDTVEDSIVRVEVSKLRRALARCYVSISEAPLRIELPRGGYAPTFVWGADAVPESRSPPSMEPVSGARMMLPSAEEDGPVIAVLPFAAISTVSTSSMRAAGPEPPPELGAPGARARAFARGLTDRLGDIFAAAPIVRVISHAAGVEEAAARGARYVLEGAVRMTPGALRVSAKLHDTRRWIQIWGNTYDRLGADDNIFAVEDQIAREIAVQTLALPQGVIHVVEAQERAGQPARSVYDSVLRVTRWHATFDPGIQRELMASAARFIADAADSGLILAFAATVHLFSYWTALGTAEDLRLGAEFARRAAAVEPKLVGARQMMAFALLHLGDGPGAIAEAEAAVALGGPLMLLGMTIALAGAWARGIAMTRAHMAVLRNPPGPIHHVFSLDAYRRGDYATALAEAETIGTPHIAWHPLDRAVALARLGRLDEAREAGRALAKLLPEAARDPRAVVARLTADEELRASLVEGLHIAGLG